MKTQRNSYICKGIVKEINGLDTYCKALDN